MSKIEGIERLEGRGITAKVTDSGQQFTTYDTFAKEIGYPDAVESLFSVKSYKGRRLLELIDETFSVLARGKHERRPCRYVYVIESSGGERFLVSEHGLDITDSEAPKDIARFDRMEYSELIEYADEVNRAVRRKAYAEGYEQGKFDQRMETEVDGIAKVTDNVGVNNEETAQESAWSDNVNPPTMDELMALGKKVLSESPQEKRDRIVEQAKKDVEELIPEDNIYEGRYYQVIKGGINLVCCAEFIINKEKRTVVAMMRGHASRGIYAKGIAKCAPDDCFNEHIGKAIALYRALGKDVPSEYLRVTNPTKVREGDVIYLEPSNITMKIRNRCSEPLATRQVAAGGVKIIDDSESRTQ